jgi:HAD superfamily hydrolase (TIGR01509 family)
MNRVMIFDLDGVLVDSKDIHFNALNNALETIDNKYVISTSDHENIYDGLPTKIKLQILTQKSGLEESSYKKIWELKQQITEKMFNEIPTDNELVKIFSYIKSKNIKIAVASNSIKSTVNQCLKSLGIFDKVDFVVSNEDVLNAKPHPEMYWKAMSYFGSIPSKTVIFEDSIIGKIAVKDSMSNLIEIKNRNDLNLTKVKEAIEMLNKGSVWHDKGLNVLIPMAGAGSRFAEAGYEFPKPLIDVNGKPMIQAVVDSLGINATYTYIVQEEHFNKYNLGYVLNLITPNCNIVKINGITEGAAITCLMAKEFINSEQPLIMANSDQIVDWDSREFMYDLYTKNADGGIATFKSTHPKWSYAKIGSQGTVVEVAEKKPISDNATVGIYYWKHGSDFVKYSEQMIKKNIRVNNEFYTCPVFNEAISDGKMIYALPVNKMWGIGTPPDLETYLKNTVGTS